MAREPSAEDRLIDAKPSDARPLHELSVEEARRRQSAERIVPSPVDGLEVTELAGAPPIRLYRPHAATPLPLCVWLPGGGWVLDTLEAADQACRRLAVETECAVAAVRYRLAPEHPFPAPLDDAVAAARWVAAHASELGLDSSRLAVGGTSAGGNLAAALALVARSDGEPTLSAQILVYPLLLHGADTESMRTVGDPLTLDRRGVEWCWSHYLADPRSGDDPLASPVLATDVSGLPPTLVITAEHDPLRDEGELYVARLREAGVEVEAVRLPGVAHGFFSGDDAAALEAQRLVVATLRRAFGLHPRHN